MIDKIIYLSIKNRFLVTVVTLVLFASAVFSINKIKVDGLPDLSPPQVIVEINFQGASPGVIQDQVTYPLVSLFNSLPNTSAIRSVAGYERSLIYIVFDDNVDLYWARTRVLEKLSEIKLIDGVTVNIGSDSTSVGWIYQYALKSDKNLGDIRGLQDYYYNNILQSIPGVSEVASAGGFIKNYEVTVDNDKLIRYGLSLRQVQAAVSKSNREIGAGLILEQGFEKIIKSSGYVKDVTDIENILLTSVNGLPIYLKDVAEINLKPMPRRGAAYLNNEEVVGGIITIKYQGNAYATLKEIKQNIEKLNSYGDVKLEPVYDRSIFIKDAIDNLIHTISEESISVLIICMLFLFHFRSALIIIITIPLCLAISVLLMRLFDVESNIMSLCGFAIAIGTMIDAAIVMVENAFKHLEKKDGTHKELVYNSAKQVGPPIFFALMIVVISFLPIFSFNGQEYKLFAPLAITKTFAMVAGALISITVVPVLMTFLLKGVSSEDKNPINRIFAFLYSKTLNLAMRFKYSFLLLCLVLVGGSVYSYRYLSKEFMPPLDEGVIMYMPVTTASIGIDQSIQLLKKTNEIIKSFDEVESVFGKVGKADTSLDPSPLSMIETYIHLKPGLKITSKEMITKLDAALQIPGLINSWTYPIRGRIDMLLTGIRTPLGIKLYGNDYGVLSSVALDIESRLRKMEQTLSVFAEKSEQGYYLNVNLKDDKLSEYGVNREDVLSVLESAVGGRVISRKIEGLASYPITVRFKDIQRNDINSLLDLYIPTKYGYKPLRLLAEVDYESGYVNYKSEKGLATQYVYITPNQGVSPGDYKEAAVKALADLKLPSGYFYEFSGQSEYMEKSFKTLTFIVPFSLVIIFILIYFALQDITNTVLCFLSLPFCLIGGFFMLFMLSINLNIAVIVGFLALFGIAAETAIVMFIYLDDSYRTNVGKMDIREIIMRGAVMRLRPKLMTTFSIIASLLPIMLTKGIGSEVMQSIAAPMLGGIVSSFFLTLYIIPILYLMLKSNKKTSGVSSRPSAFAH